MSKFSARAMALKKSVKSSLTNDIMNVILVATEWVRANRLTKQPIDKEIPINEENQLLLEMVYL